MSNYFDLWKLLAGLGLFLFSMNLLELALRQLAGNRFQQFLRYTTDKPVHSAISGIIATTIVQSSSLVGLIVLAFVGADLIPLVNAIGIILGSNLGTTFTGWLVATLGFKLDFTTLIYPVLALGSLSYSFLKGHGRTISQLLVSLALLLMGLEFMKSSVSTLTTLVDMQAIRDLPLIVYLVIGIIFTAIIQSSSATMMLTLSALYADIIPIQAAAALIIGADLGTTSTVLLGSIQGEVSKRRLAMAHVLFNLSVDTLAFIAIYPLLALINLLHISDPLYTLVAFHSLFNLFGLLLFLPAIKQFAHFLEHWIKEEKVRIEQYIHTVPVSITDAAIEALNKETKQLIYLVITLNLRFLQLPHRGEADSFTLPASLISGSKLDHYIAIKKLEGEIISYALNINLKESNGNHTDKTEQLTHRIENLIKAVRSAVYSAKSLKDIAENLEVFHAVKNETIRNYFDNLKSHSQAIYNESFILLSKSSDADKDSIIEELNTLAEKSQNFHHELSDSIYKKISTLHLTSLELSTLLNVNKEIQTSENALIKSIQLC